MTDAKPIEIIRRLKEKRELRKYFKEIGYPEPSEKEISFDARESSLESITKDLSDEECEVLIRTNVVRYIQGFSHKPKEFLIASTNGTKKMEAVEELIDFCDKKEFYQMRTIMRFIKRIAAENEEAAKA